jgi:hypothetical protein
LRSSLSPESAFGLVLRSVRENRRLSQEEHAARSGYHRTYIGQLERGEKWAECVKWTSRKNHQLVAVERKEGD